MGAVASAWTALAQHGKLLTCGTRNDRDEFEADDGFYVYRSSLKKVHVGREDVVPPGPVAAAGIAGADNGLLLLVGLPVSIATAIVGYHVSKALKTEKVELLESPATKSLEVAPGEGNAAENSSVTIAGSSTKRRLGAGTVVIALILLPIFQIMMGTVGNMTLEGGSKIAEIAGLVGASPIALLTAVIVACLVVGHNQGWLLESCGRILDGALPDIAVIVFVTGACGVFANVLAPRNWRNGIRCSDGHEYADHPRGLHYLP